MSNNFSVTIADDNTVVSLANSLLELTEESMFFNNKKPAVMTRAQARDAAVEIKKNGKLVPYKETFKWSNPFLDNVTKKGNVVWQPVIEKAKRSLYNLGVLSTSRLPVVNLSVWLVFKNSEKQEEFLIAVSAKAPSVPSIDIEAAMVHLRSKFKGAELIREDFEILTRAEYSVDTSKNLFVSTPVTLHFTPNILSEFRAYPFSVSQSSPSGNNPLNHFIFDRALNKLILVSKVCNGTNPEVYAGMLKLWAKANEHLLFSNNSHRYAGFVIAWAYTTNRPSELTTDSSYNYPVCPLVVNATSFNTEDNPISVYNQNRLKFLPEKSRQLVVFKPL